MKKVKDFICILVLVLIAPEILVAQHSVSDTLKLEPVDITADRFKTFTPGASEVNIDSSSASVPSASAGSLLTMHSSAFIKSYGSGGAATISVRGTEPRHTAVLWNGFNINSPTLGLTDLSIVPAAAGDGMTLLMGGASPIYGNSALGGTLVLERLAPAFIKRNRYHFSAEAGSFGNFHARTDLFNSGKKISSHTVLLYSQSENDFEFSNLALQDQPTQQLTHSRAENYGVFQDLDFRTGKTGVLSASLWYQVSGRQIPPTMLAQSSHATQRDSVLRTSVSWKASWNKSALEIKGAYFNEVQLYQDPQYEIDASYTSNSYLTEASWRYKASEKIMLHSGIGYTANTAAFKEYKDKKEREVAALFAGVFWNPFIHTDVGINLRQELYSDETIPFCPSLHIENRTIQDVLRIRASVSRNFNLPSMNDLFWQPGGNPELNPEDAWSSEIGFVLQPFKNKYTEIGVTGFTANIRNWIKWIPVAGGIYSPRNIDNVQTRGIESYFSYSKSIAFADLKFRIHYTYCHSEWTGSDMEYNSSIEGMQLIYVPIHAANINFTMKRNKWTVQYDQSYTGLRYTTADNTDALDPYNIANLKIEKAVHFKQSALGFYLSIQNIWDAGYQVIAWRPMPGRWVMAGLTFRFEKVP
jgi:vitamin B12 transporter